MIVLLYKYIRKKERTQEALAQRSIPTKFEMETTKKQQKEMKKQTGYYNIRGQKDPYGDLLVVKPGINKWTELTYKKKKKKKDYKPSSVSINRCDHPSRLIVTN